MSIQFYESWIRVISQFVSWLHFFGPIAGIFQLKSGYENTEKTITESQMITNIMNIVLKIKELQAVFSS